MSGFIDYQRIDLWVETTARKLSEAGVINGDNDEFIPHKEATLAEVAQMFKIFLRFIILSFPFFCTKNPLNVEITGFLKINLTFLVQICTKKRDSETLKIQALRVFSTNNRKTHVIMLK
jgi:hypothetical protein